MKFYLGTHKPHWLGLYDIPFFVSHRTLRDRKTFPRALTGWAYDGGGFTELSLYGKWTISAKEYIEKVKLCHSEIGNLDFAAIQDWMCEPFITEKTGKTVFEHQTLTIESYLELKDSVPGVLFIPILQGWTVRDYEKHIEMYDKAGIDLRKCEIVGLGSVCRRQSTKEIQEMIRHFFYYGLKLHGFGIKKQGLREISDYLRSADSMAWSYSARNSQPLPNHTHKNCANCIDYARNWYHAILENLGATRKQWLWGM